MAQGTFGWAHVEASTASGDGGPSSLALLGMTIVRTLTGGVSGYNFESIQPVEHLYG